MSVSSSDYTPFHLEDESDSHGVGLSNPQLSQDRRHMLDLVNRLHNTGVQVDIDLPMIAVIGSQSAGKSSLIESISGITLPRAAGTCTRCPTECRLSRSTNDWKCVVALHRTKDGKVTIEQFGQPILENAKSQVEDRIRRAQRAILNPSKEAKYYLTAKDDDYSESELSFSKDRVSLQISGPDVADLSFCDLPGLIAGVGRDGNKNDIALVESLATSYIKKPSCIILLTVACETDFQNQGAQELAKVHDPEGRRTIGVLTKPDRIPTGEEPSWLAFIRNEKEPLENNWYCVKQPGSNDLKQGMIWTDARRSEDQFFSFTSPWCELDEMYKKYLGTANLVSRLSSILSDLISKRVPEIQDELERSILSAKQALKKLPKEPSKDPHNEVATLIYEFVTNLGRRVEGLPDKDGIMQSIRPAHDAFRRAVRVTAPEFRPFDKQDAEKKTFDNPDFLVNEEEHKQNDGPGHVFVSNPVGSGEERPSAETASLQVVQNLFYIDEVLERAQHARTRELQGSYPFVVQESFIKAIIEQWNTPAQILCKTVYSIINVHVKQLVSEHFSAFGQGGLEQRIRVLIQDHLRKCMDKTENHITWLLDLEERPFTLNNHYLSDYRDKFLSHYRATRQKDRNPTLTSSVESHAHNPLPPSGPTSINRVLAALAEMDITGIKPEDLAKLIPLDGMEHALVIMADVRAYFQVAYKRFVDNVPLAVDHDLVRGITRGVLQTLNTGLGVNGPNGHRICKELAQESPSMAGKREELSKKLERLNIASQELLNLRF